MSKHTPGPWHTGGKAETIIYDASGFAVANARTNHGQRTENDTTANTLLIAAAPELFAIVQDEASLYAGMDADEFTPSTAARIKAMRSIIAKVTGEPDRCS